MNELNAGNPLFGGQVARHGNGIFRDIDANDLVAGPREEQRKPSRPAAEIEHGTRCRRQQQQQRAGVGKVFATVFVGERLVLGVILTGWVKPRIVCLFTSLGVAVEITHGDSE